MLIKSISKLRFAAAAAGILALTGFAAPSHAGSLENLERERAILIETMLSADMTPEERGAPHSAGAPPKRRRKDRIHERDDDDDDDALVRTPQPHAER